MINRALAIVTSVVAALFLLAAPANAEPVTVNGGDQFSVVGGQFSPTLAAVGYWQGQRVAMTASHNGSKGTVALKNGVRFGEFITNPNELGRDVGFIKLDDDVAFGHNRGLSVVADPKPVYVVCKYGYGIANSGERCGLNISASATKMCSLYLTTPQDSGGPVYWGNRLFGVSSQVLAGGCPSTAAKVNGVGFTFP
ncbi:peptidase S1 [Gordonia phage Yvonnetastic]|uniref:Peptidase S1 n=1 Tax=Gordonia phage Yvonnetastic TaxID=1821566 RepID=A0A142K920_9CAUD|nr:peptidase S1 [Gordonia phage Yvonnetastic]AMS02603.1 peptidase S1 [Gordonia phage Yvonnetastic]WKW86035.1 serine protease [Gordonia Phage JonJames]